ncbi:hypothetical protein DFH06DRAFT_1311374 [Mycena polygramma]|nr:hypothetical protein DFH06DRAFT_1311374 [Mycena polygramma]
MSRAVEWGRGEGITETGTGEGASMEARECKRWNGAVSGARTRRGKGRENGRERRGQGWRDSAEGSEKPQRDQNGDDPPPSSHSAAHARSAHLGNGVPGFWKGEGTLKGLDKVLEVEGGGMEEHRTYREGEGEANEGELVRHVRPRMYHLAWAKNIDTTSDSRALSEGAGTRVQAVERCSKRFVSVRRWGGEEGKTYRRQTDWRGAAARVGNEAESLYHESERCNPDDDEGGYGPSHSQYEAGIDRWREKTPKLRTYTPATLVEDYFGLVNLNNYQDMNSLNELESLIVDICTLIGEKRENGVFAR